MIACWINGRDDDRVSVKNRALQYGDGLFETVRVRNEHPEFLGRHLSRLRVGCERLKLGEVNWRSLESQLRQCAVGIDGAILKVMLIRGQGARGYAFDASKPVESIVCLYPAASFDGEPERDGVRIRVCKMRLSAQPLLAGIKHLNRLEQILARSEWTDETVAEGLMLDNRARIIEGTMSNLFVIAGEQLFTPGLSGCGVSGILRSVVLDTAREMNIETTIRPLTLEDLGRVDELFICNSVIGIWPVRDLLGLAGFNIGPLTRKLQAMVRYRDDNSLSWYPE